MVWFDRIIMAGIACLLIFSPFAIGSVNPWAFSADEAIIFFLTIVWMARLAMDNGPQTFPGLRPLLLPAAALAALILFQLLPLPPSVERALSPSTYRLYATSLPGWPERDSYPERGDEHDATIAGSAKRIVLPDRSAAPALRSHSGWLGAIRRWRPLSIAPGLTRTAALQLISYGCLFFLILFYPLPKYPRPYGERRFLRRVLKLVLIVGLAVGCVGLLERAFWNGAILWTYIPYDWGQPRPDLDSRALGPFVNPNHFAAYLNLILPLALSGALFETFLSFRLSPLRILCLATASVITSAIALSLSRGGWTGGLLALSILAGSVLLERSRLKLERPGIWLRIPAAIYVVVVLCVVAASAAYIAPPVPAAVNTRLEGTVSEPDLGTRVGYWRDSLSLIRDFPVVGVGFGCFQDLFPRYQSPPWNPVSVREAHDDYLELVVDAGLAGAALLLWFFAAAGLRLYRGFATARPEVRPVIVALIAGLAAVAVQEVFDFVLQIPANAVLFTILLAIALRLSGAARGDGSEIRYPAAKVRQFAAGIGAAALLLIVCALRQDSIPYPYLPAPPRNARAAIKFILEHPASATPHLWYATLEPRSAAGQMRELTIAASLEPNNPLILDQYAQALAAQGRTASALTELKRSVFVYPSIADHFYLQADMIPWLSIEERKAIDAGLRGAVAHHFQGAVSTLAAFCAALHHDEAEADALTRASSVTDQSGRRVQLLLEAGAAYARAGARAQAADAFTQAARIEPANPQPYEALLIQIFAPRKDIDSAKALVQKALKNGVDPFALYTALAQVYEQAGDLDGAEAAMLKTFNVRPGARYDFSVLMHLANLETRAGHFDRAALWLRQVAELRPDSPDVLYQLAQVEESDYEYGPALRDLERALKLAPHNSAMMEHYRNLHRMIAEQSDHKQP